MEYFFIQFLFFSIIFVLISNSTAEWIQTSVSPIDQTYTAATWIGNGTVIAVGALSSGYIVQSVDFGVSWTQIATNLSASSFYGVSSKSVRGTTYIVTGDEGGIIYSAKSTDLQFSSTTTLVAAFFGVTLASNGRVVLGGLNSLVVANITSLSSYKTKSISNAGKFFGVSTSDGTNIIGATSSGKIYYSTNGGSSFAQSTRIYSTDVTFSSTTTALYAASSGNSSLAFVGGASGKMYRTEDFGYSWRLCTSPYSSTQTIQYQAISVLRVVNVFVASSGGSIYKSTDKCSSWNLLSSTGSTLTSLSMLSFSRGVAGASSGNGIFTLVPGKHFRSNYFIF